MFGRFFIKLKIFSFKENLILTSGNIMDKLNLLFVFEDQYILYSDLLIFKKFLKEKNLKIFFFKNFLNFFFFKHNDVYNSFFYFFLKKNKYFYFFCFEKTFVFDFELFYNLLYKMNIISYVSVLNKKKYISVLPEMQIKLKFIYLYINKCIVIRELVFTFLIFFKKLIFFFNKIIINFYQINLFFLFFIKIYIYIFNLVIRSIYYDNIKSIS